MPSTEVMISKVDGVAKGEFVRRAHDLPHWQIGGRTYFLTFRTLDTVLSTDERRIVLDVIHEGRKRHFALHAAVVMPDHVHRLITPREKVMGVFFDLADVNKGIKGTSARRVNMLRGTTGPIWQLESYDHMIRDERDFGNTWNYIFNNPTWAHLVANPEEYQFFWSEVFDPCGE